MKKEKIEKANKWAVGMTKEYNGQTYVVHKFNAKGVPLWKLVKKNDSGGNVDDSSKTKNTKDTNDANGGTSAPQNKDVKTTVNKPKKEAVYDAPTPQIQYKNKKPADGVVFHVPETWEATNPKTGKLKTFERSVYRKVYADKTKMPDTSLLKILNNPRNMPEFRQLAYEEAMARGISEDKIDVSGRLQDKWDNLEFKMNLKKQNSGEDVSEEEFEDYDVEMLRGMDVDEFMKNFPEGDDGWKSREDQRVRKQFNNFITLADRQKYDAFLDYQNRKDPYYDGPKEQVCTLARKMFNFIDSKKSPLMVSAGGAGAGKTTTFLKVASRVPAEIFDPKKHKPGDGDYDIFIVDKDVDDEKDLRRLLADHNGKVIVFDDKDKLLTSTASATVSLMKSIADGNPNMRLFKNPKTGEQDKFTGQLLFLTNKSMDTLNKDEDHVAIMSRGIKHDIHFTINETIDVLRDRYKTMGDKMKHAGTPQNEDMIREKVFKIIVNNKDKIDPDKFTVRKFTEALEEVDGILSTNKMIDEDDSASELFGGKKSWDRAVIQILNKANSYDELSKSVTSDDAMSKESVAKLKKMYEKDPEGTVDLFGKKVIEIINSDTDTEEEQTDEEVIKAMMNEMSVEEAEALLFN